MVGPEARGAYPVELVEGREPQGLGCRAGRAEEHRIHWSPRHFPLNSPLPIREEVGPGYSLDLPGEGRKGILASGHVHLDYPQDVRMLRGRRRDCVRIRLNVHQELELQKLVGNVCTGQ